MNLDHANEFRRCLDQVDVDGVRKLWAHVSPHLRQPETELEALITLHMARAECPALTIKQRQYSDRWLRERGIGSMLPEELRPKGWKARW